MLNKLLNFYLYSSFHISLGAFFLCLYTFNALNRTVDYNVILWISSSTLIIYSIHRLIGITKYNEKQYTGRFEVIKDFQAHIKIYLVIAIICASFFFSKILYLIPYVTVPCILALAYTIPIFKNKKRLRDFNFIKIFLIATIWSFLTTMIPIKSGSELCIWMILLFLERFLFILSITIPFDIRDLEIDQKDGIHSIPSFIGINDSYILSYILLLLAFIINLHLFYSGYIKVDVTISAFLSYLFTFFSMMWIKGKKSDYYFSGILDGTMMFPLVFLFLIRYIF